MHSFWESIFVQAFWNGIKQWMSKRPCFPNGVFTFQSCLGFVDNAFNSLSHHFLLLCRYHINAPFPITSSLHTGLSYLLRSGETLCSSKWKLSIVIWIDCIYVWYACISAWLRFRPLHSILSQNRLLFPWHFICEIETHGCTRGASSQHLTHWNKALQLHREAAGMLQTIISLNG